MKTLAVRFWSKVDKSPHQKGCWIWTARKDATGYGSIWVDRRSVGAHRASWELHNGPIPVGLFLLHRCDNPPCVNPDHLFPGTNADNMRDMAQKGRSGKPTGGNSPNSKLTYEEVGWIRRIAKTKKLSQEAIARIFKVHSTTICDILTGRTWRDQMASP